MVELSATSRSLDPSYWLELCPGSTIGDVPGLAPPEGQSPEVSGAADSLRSLGWFRLPAAAPGPLVERARAVVEKLVEAGWPPSYAFVFDEFWQILQLPAVGGLAAELLGPGFELRLNPWINHVGRGGHEAGWAPHADGEPGPGNEAAGRVPFLGVWLALAPATLDNGCMYVLPTAASRDYLAWMRGAEKTPAEALQLAGRSLHQARALPADSGDALGWHGEIIHWGAPASDLETAPRISVALEYQSAAAPWRRWPLWRPSAAVPAFEGRLRVIASTVLRFASGPFQPIDTNAARQILDALGPAPEA